MVIRILAGVRAKVLIGINIDRQRVADADFDDELYVNNVDVAVAAYIRHEWRDSNTVRRWPDRSGQHPQGRENAALNVHDVGFAAAVDISNRILALCCRLRSNQNQARHRQRDESYGATKCVHG